MKIVLNSNDILLRVGRSLEDEGIKVKDAVWGPDCVLELEVEFNRPEQQPALNVELVRELMAEMMASLRRQDQRPDQKHQKKTGQPQKAATPADIKELLEKEQELIGNPLGSTLQRGTRPLAKNEFEEFPG